MSGKSRTRQSAAMSSRRLGRHAQLRARPFLQRAEDPEKVFRAGIGKACCERPRKCLSGADLEKNYWSDDFVTGAQFRKDLNKDYADMKAVLVELGLAKQ